MYFMQITFYDLILLLLGYFELQTFAVFFYFVDEW